MPKIIPISDLRNYSSVLDTVSEGSPVYLTKNGRGCFTIMDMEEQEHLQEKADGYDRMEAQLKLMCELNTGKRSGEESGWVSDKDIRNHFKVRADEI